MKFGVLLPHYGQFCSRERVLGSGPLLDRCGFDSVWVRDHLIWRPHGMEGDDRTFLDAFLTLMAVAATSTHVELGTAVTIPIRWPLKIAQNVSTLSYLARRTVHMGFGLGSNKEELGAAGFDINDREAIFAETVEICRQAWDVGSVNWHGSRFDVDNVSLEPRPADDVVTWYGGTTRASVRRAVRHCDGWIPGRLPMATFDDRLALLCRLGDEAGKPMRAATIPLVYLARSRDEARKAVDVRALAHSSEGSDRWIRPPSGEFRTIEDLEGALIAGSPEDCLVEIEKFHRRGVEHLVFDFRLQFDRFEEQVQWLAQEVLPGARQL